MDHGAADPDRVISFLEQARRLTRLAELPGRRFDDRYAPRFDPVGLIAAEAGWSKVIATLLDPGGDHGQGRWFLDAFLREIGIDPTEFRGEVEVGTERRLVADRKPVGRIDILVSAPKAVLGIEVKFDAADQDAQLARYHAALRELRVAEPVLVYLAKPGARPDRVSMAGLREGHLRLKTPSCSH